MSATLAVWRRELAGYVHAPIALVVGVLFLAMQGLSFWALVETLSDPTRPSPLGAVLSGYFGGNLLYWSVLFLVVAALAMRLVAEERAAGTWELLLTTRAGARAILVGKWLGALSFYLLLWAPTLAFPVVLSVYAPPGVSLDPGPIAAAYLGVALAGAGFLGIGLAASSATRNQIVAAVLTFAALFALLLFGQLGELAPAWTADAPRLAAVVAWVDVRAHMNAFAAGAIDLGSVVFYLGLAAVGLALATALIAIGRRQRGEVQARLLAAALIAVIVVLGNIIVARAPARWDTTRAGVNSLRPMTASVLDRLDGAVELELVAAVDPAWSAEWGHAADLARRFAARQPRIALRHSDLSLDGARAAALAGELDLRPRDLEDQGAIIVRHRGRVRVVDLVDHVAREASPDGEPILRRLPIESALVDALVEVTAPEQPTLCATSGHGELSMVPVEGEPHWGRLRQRLEVEGYTVVDVGGLAGGVPAHCRGLLVMGPAQPLPPDEALAVAAYLGGGGAVLVATLAALDPTSPQPALPMTGLELVLDDYGIGLPQAIASDPGAAVDRLPGGFRVDHDGADRYGITAGFAGRRFSVWQLPRVISLTGEGAEALAATTAAGWGETDLTTVGATTEADARDLPGGVVIAAASAVDRGRVVVFGSARALSSELEVGAAVELAARAIAWMTGRLSSVSVGEGVPERIDLVMTRDERTRVFVVCVVVIPLLFGGAGGLAWRRRRRA